jgi:hypothetical protein
LDFISRLLTPQSSAISSGQEKSVGFPCPNVNGFGKDSVKRLILWRESAVEQEQFDCHAKANPNHIWDCAYGSKTKMTQGMQNLLSCAYISNYPNEPTCLEPKTNARNGS